MKWVWGPLFFLYVIVALLGTNLKAESIRFVTIDYCPFACNSDLEKGREGIMTDVLRRAFESIGYKLEFTTFPYARAVKLVEAGKYDGITVVAKINAPTLVYPDCPTIKQPVAFYVKKGHPWKFTGADSLSKVRVGVVKGYSYGNRDIDSYLKENAHTDRVVLLHGEDTIERAVIMLQHNRLDTYIDGEFSAVYFLSKFGLNEKVTTAGYGAKKFKDYTGFSPHHPNAELYARILSDKITELMQSGELDRIVGHYGFSLK